MNSRRPLRLFLLATVVLTGVCFAGVKTQLIRAQALSDTMPVDPQITIGTLPNGIRYYIRANKKPKSAPN